uniref:Putative secreted protein n=1 Tax=Anopheles darlingi TaxID=43151 RepID=A0A2M4D124_ANODA
MGMLVVHDKLQFIAAHVLIWRASGVFLVKGASRCVCFVSDLGAERGNKERPKPPRLAAVRARRGEGGRCWPTRSCDCYAGSCWSVRRFPGLGMGSACPSRSCSVHSSRTACSSAGAACPPAVR